MLGKRYIGAARTAINVAARAAYKMTKVIHYLISLLS